MRTVLVTGGAGFIGSHLVDQLLDGGAAVRVLDNLSTGSLVNLQSAAEGHPRNGGGASHGGRLEVIIGDVRDRELLRKALRNVKYVFHLAALPTRALPITDLGDIHAVNVEGTLNVLHGALTEGVWRVVLSSCASVYGIPETVPVAFHARHQLEAVMLRYFSIYGPRQGASAAGPLTPGLVNLLRQRRLLVDQDERQCEDFMYVDDAVAATLAAARAPRAAGRVINVGSGQMVAMSDALGILSNLLRTPVVSGIPKSADGPVQRMCADTTLATELLDFTPRVSLVAGLARMITSMDEAAEPERAALEPAGRDD
jgi:nucleoside-diphosphate-sugar epimerase